jgi:hypothetical protein
VASRSQVIWDWYRWRTQAGVGDGWGHITKQGNSLLRFLLVEAAQVTVRSDPRWRSRYHHVMMRRGRKIAKVAMARRLAVRMYWMVREEGAGYPFNFWMFYCTLSRCSGYPDVTTAHAGLLVGLLSVPLGEPCAALDLIEVMLLIQPFEDGYGAVAASSLCH